MADPVNLTILMSENLASAIREAGYSFYIENGQMFSENATEVQAIVDTWDEVAYVAQKTAEANAAAQDEADVGLGGINEATWIAIRAVLRENNQDHNKFALRVREIEETIEAMRTSTGGTANLRAVIPQPSQDVTGSPPATFSRMQDRQASNLISDVRQRIRGGEGTE